MLPQISWRGPFSLLTMRSQNQSPEQSPKHKLPNTVEAGSGSDSDDGLFGLSASGGVALVMLIVFIILLVICCIGLKLGQKCVVFVLFYFVCVCVCVCVCVPQTATLNAATPPPLCASNQ